VNRIMVVIEDNKNCLTCFLHFILFTLHFLHFNCRKTSVF